MELARCHKMHTLKQNKGTYTELETGEDIPTQGNKPSTGCVGSLSLAKEMVQVQGTFLCGLM